MVFQKSIVPRVASNCFLNVDRIRDVLFLRNTKSKQSFLIVLIVGPSVRVVASQYVLLTPSQCLEVNQ